MRVLIACEFSGIVREAFAQLGHDAWSCDLIDTEIAGCHLKCNVLDILNDNWDLMIAHPPCTYLTNAGSRHFYAYVTSSKGKRAKINGPERVQKSEEAIEFFLKLKNANIKYIAIENPIPHKWARLAIGNYNQLIHPYLFGHPYTKGTCLWLKNLPTLNPTNIIPNQGLKSFAHTEVRKPKDRSRTFIGIANAMALQWGSLS